MDSDENLHKHAVEFHPSKAQRRTCPACWKELPASEEAFQVDTARRLYLYLIQPYTGLHFQWVKIFLVCIISLLNIIGWFTICLVCITSLLYMIYSFYAKIRQKLGQKQSNSDNSHVLRFHPSWYDLTNSLWYYDLSLKMFTLYMAKSGKTSKIMAVTVILGKCKVKYLFIYEDVSKYITDCQENNVLLKVL